MATPASRYQPSARAYQGVEELEYPRHDWTAVITTCGRICYLFADDLPNVRTRLSKPRHRKIKTVKHLLQATFVRKLRRFVEDSRHLHIPKVPLLSLVVDRDSLDWLPEVFANLHPSRFLRAKVPVVVETMSGGTNGDAKSVWKAFFELENLRVKRYKGG
jgi:hypothetical protein